MSSFEISCLVLPVAKAEAGAEAEAIYSYIYSKIIDDEFFLVNDLQIVSLLQAFS
jgi:hypothetical protein